MPGGIEDVGIDAVRALNDGSVLGALVVLLILLIIWREVFYWPKQTGKLDAEIQRSHAAHDKTREALLEELRKGGEQLVLCREQMKSQQQAVDALMKLASDWSHRNRRDA